MGGIHLEAVELRRVRLGLVTPFRTSQTTWTGRDVLLVRAVADGVEGWGECVAMAEPVYSEECTDGAHAVIRDHLLPRLFAAGVASGAEVGPALAEVAGNRMAKAALEAAVLDAQLRAEGVSLAAHLGATTGRVEVGVSVGIPDGLDELVSTVAGHLAEGYRRVKIKIRPGWDVEPVRRLRDELGTGWALQVDANGAYPTADLDALRPLDEFGLSLIEQPFPAECLLEHAELARVLDTAVCLDETIVSETACDQVLRLGAADVIALKPGRVGGHLAGRRIHDRCRDEGVPVWHGGMLETGIGRAANLALAALPGFTLPADISAADRYWNRDVVTEPAVLEPDGTIAVPTGPGIGVDVDADFIDSVTYSLEVHRC